MVCGKTVFHETGPWGQKRLGAAVTGHREEASVFPDKRRTELCTTLVMTGTLSVHLSQPACSSNSSCSPRTSHLPVWSFPEPEREPQRHRVPWDGSGPLRARRLAGLGLQGCRLQVAGRGAAGSPCALWLRLQTPTLTS